MDTLSQIVSLLKPTHLRAVGLDAGSSWSLDFGPYGGIKFNAVVSGSCWLTMEGLGEPLRIEAGDFFLLSHGTPFQLATDPKATPTDAQSLFESLAAGQTACLNGGGDFFLFGSRFMLGGDHASLLLSALPPLVHIRARDSDGTLAWALQRLQVELREQPPGGHLAVDHLAHLMLIEVLRRYVSSGTAGIGWLRALSDPKISQALKLMHEQPERRWTLIDLARQVGMSRTSFAVHFKASLGLPPIEYLIRWRMALATERLLSSEVSVAVLAADLGYESESAFGAVFKKMVGCSPRSYARTHAANQQANNASGEAGQNPLSPIALQNLAEVI